MERSAAAANTEWRETGIGAMFADGMHDGSTALRGASVDGPRSRRASSRLRGDAGNFVAPLRV